MGNINKPIELAFLVTILLLVLSLTLFFMPRTIKRSFAVETVNVGVYWDARCIREITEIKWGNLTPSSTTNINIYIRNEETLSPCFLFLMTKSWTPVHASNYITLSWNYKNKPLNPNEAIPIILTLRVSPHITGIDNFTFTITIMGTEDIVGDINSDGIVNMLDALRFSTAYGSTLSDTNWNPSADFNNDNSVNMLDATMFAANYRV